MGWTSERIGFVPSEPVAIIAWMERISAAEEGWVNLRPCTDDDDSSAARRGQRPFAVLFGLPPEEVLCTWMPPRPSHRRPRGTLGILHRRGRGAAAALRRDGMQEPEGWQLTQDHARRGLLYSLPPRVQPAAVVAWLVPVAEHLSAMRLTGRWQADVFHSAPPGTPRLATPRLACRQQADVVMDRSVLFITVDQWRGDCLSALGHPVVETPALDGLAAKGVLFANHWANAAPCGPSRACLYTGTYLHRNRSVLNGTPLDARFATVATLARQKGYDPVLFGYTDTSVDPRTVGTGDPLLSTYEGVLPGFRVEVYDPQEAGSPAWMRWLAAQGVDVPADPSALFEPLPGYPGSDRHGSSWAPARFRPEHSETAFLAGEVRRWLERHGDEPFFVHASFIRPHPPRRNPIGYHDLYDAEAVPQFVAASTRQQESAMHPLNAVVTSLPGVGVPDDERERRQLRATYYGAQREVDDRLGELFTYIESSGLSRSTLVVVTSDHGEMGGDHWLLEKLGYWDESYRVPLIVVDPDPSSERGRGSITGAVTESVDVLPTICEWLGIEVPRQADGWSLLPFLRSGCPPEHWRTEAHFEWDFSSPVSRAAERYFGIPSAHCALAVSRSATHKYVQFAADPSVLPPLLFDLSADPWQLENLLGHPGHEALAFEEAARLVRWRMRNDERTLSTHLVGPGHGLVVAHDDWR